MKKIILILICSCLLLSCMRKTTESWHPHNHKIPKSYKHKMEDIDLKKFINNKFIYDEDGQFIFHVDKEDKLQKIADLRAWGAIQNLFMNKKSGQIDFKKADEFQDKLGNWIVDSLNKSIKE